MENVIALITGLPNWSELLIVLVIGLLFFGKRLPDVARSLGKSVVEFKRGVRDIKEDVDVSSRPDTTRRLEAPEKPSLPSSPPPSSAPEATPNDASAKESVNSGEQS